MPIDVNIQDNLFADLITQTPISVEVLANRPTSETYITWTYTHAQIVAETVWNATHNLNRLITSAIITDSGGNQWHPVSITNIDNNNVSVKVGDAPFGGTMILS